MLPETFDENYGIDPERADELRRRAKEVVEGVISGDEEAIRTYQQLDVLIRLDSNILLLSYFS